MTAFVATGKPKAAIERAAAEKQTKVDQGETVIVGVNKYQLAEEELIETLEVDNAAVRAGQIKRLAEVRAGRDEAACQAALSALTEGCASGGNVLELAVEAARHDATLGEISAAMEEIFGRHDATPKPVTGVYKSA